VKGHIVLDANNTKDIHIDHVKVGDTVLHNGDILTVCATNIRKSSFMGTSLFGDTYSLGHKPVKVLQEQYDGQ
jgi:hypothetical protein